MDCGIAGGSVVDRDRLLEGEGGRERTREQLKE
jgi:hypothetical protein